MPLAFLLIAAALIIVAYRNTYTVLFQQLETDAPGFAKWGIAITVIGLLQYIPDFGTAAKSLLALVLLVIVVANKGAFANFTAAVSGSPAAVQGGPVPALTSNPTIDISGASSSSSNLISTGVSSLGPITSLLGF